MSDTNQFPIPNYTLPCYYSDTSTGSPLSLNLTYSCDPGFYCPNITLNVPATLPVACPPSLLCQNDRLYGQVCKEMQGKYEPLVCPPGYYCPTFREKIRCASPQGYFCPTGSTFPRACHLMASCPGGTVSEVFYGGIIFCILFDVMIILTAIYLKYQEKRNRLTVAQIQDQEDEKNDSGALIQAFERGLNHQNLSLLFEFIDLGYKTKDGTTILSGVTGSVQPGRLTTIMGPSGSGKTTFMNVLMGKVDGTTGTLYVNSQSSAMHPFKKVIGFVPQEDIMMKDLSVKENIRHSARVRLPSTWTSKQVDDHCQSILKALNLSHVAHTLIGDETTRGISGGQRKRVNIGMELAAVPLALFLDEPTSGLDSTAALHVCDILKNIAQLGKTVCCVLHQPRREIFMQFDDILLIVPGGLTAYLGPVVNVQSYFEALDFEFPTASNPADVLMDILSHPYNRQGIKVDLVKKWIEFQNAKQEIKKPNPQADPNSLKDIIKLSKERGSSWIQQAWWCHNRYLTQQFRHISSLLLELFVGLAAGLLMGISVGQAKGELYRGAYNGFYSLISPAPLEFVLPLYGLLIGFSVTLAGSPAGVKVFSEEKPVFWREAASGHSRSAYYVGKSIAATPRFLLSSLHFASIYQFLAVPTFPDFPMMFSIVFLKFFGTYGMSAFVSSLVSRDNANLLSVIFGIFAAALNGFGPSLKEAKEWGVIFIWELSFNKWGTQAFFSSSIKDQRHVFNIDQTAKYYGYTLGNERMDLGMMFLLGILFRIAAFMGLTLLHKSKQH